MVLDAGPAPRVAWGRNWGGVGPNASTGSGTKGEITSDDRSNVYVVSTYGSGIEVAGTPYVTNRFGGLVIKYDAMGTRQWVRNFNTPGTGDFIPVRLFWDRVRDEVVVLANGFGGEARVDATRVGTRPLSSSAVVVRLDATTGNVVGGGYVFGSSQWDSLALGRTASGNILIGGAFFSNLTLPDGTVVNPIAPGTADALIVEWNYVTNTVVRHFVVGGAGHESVFAVAELPDGDIVLGGRYSSAVPTMVGGIAVPATVGDDAMIARIAPTGAVRAFRVLRGPGNGQAVNEVQVGPSGDYYLSGYYDGSVEYDAMTPRTLSGSSSGSFVARVRAADNDWAWFVGQTGGGGTIEGVRRFSIDPCERVHVAFSTSARDSFTEFAGVSLSPSGTAISFAHAFIGVMRGSDGSLVRLDRLGPTTAGFFGVQAMTLLPDGRHAIKGDLSGTMTVDGTTFTTPDNMVDQFAATLSF